MEAKKKLLTYAGLKALEDELENLKVVKRREIAQKIKEAREQGDLSENAEYDAAKDEQRDIEARIEELEAILKNAEVVVEDEVDLDTISVGCKVKVYDVEFDEEIELIMTRKQKSYKTKGYKYLSNSSPFDFLDSENLFYTLHLRLTQFQLENGVYECIASNLDKEEFPPEKIKELYHMRWGIETSFRELKYTIGLTNLHSKNVEYICQEIYAKLIQYNFCEIISANIILEERNRKYTYQLNYTMAIQIYRHYLRQTFVTIDVEGLIKKELSPQRPHRQYQRRVIKKRWVSFAYRIG